MHRVCVISDDLYYLRGFQEAISQKIETIMFTGLKECMEKINKYRNTLFIISINSLNIVRELVDGMSGMGMKMLLVYDIPSSRAYSHARFLSKRNSVDHTIRFLMNTLFGRGPKLNSITSRQASIIRRLAEGQGQIIIANDDCCSSKTISGIKKGIADKLGLKMMNDLSLLMADIIIRAIKI